MLKEIILKRNLWITKFPNPPPPPTTTESTNTQNPRTQQGKQTNNKWGDCNSNKNYSNFKRKNQEKIKSQHYSTTLSQKR